MYLFRSTQSWGPGEQYGALGVLNEWHKDVGPRCVPRLEVMRLVHDDHCEMLPAQGLHQVARICGEQAIT